MITAYQLLLSCPDAQRARCRLAYEAILAGDWANAATWLANAAAEESGQWSEAAAELGKHCKSLVDIATPARDSVP